MTQAAYFEVERVGLTLGGTEILRELSLEIGAGEQVAMIGPSGAGKTSLLRVLCGGIAPTTGLVKLDGEAYPRQGGASGDKLRRLRSRVGFVHQDHALVPNLRVMQNVVAGKFGRRGFWSSLRSLAKPTSSDQEQVFELLERVGIEDKIFHRVDSLSGGQQQRAAIARALFQDPEALLADEPVASVDPARARAVLKLLISLSRERGLTLAVSLHDPRLAIELFPRVIGLREGRVHFDQPSCQISDAELEELYRLEE